MRDLLKHSILRIFVSPTEPFSVLITNTNCIVQNLRLERKRCFEMFDYLTQKRKTYRINDDLKNDSAKWLEIHFRCDPPHLNFSNDNDFNRNIAFLWKFQSWRVSLNGAESHIIPAL